MVCRRDDLYATRRMVPDRFISPRRLGTRGELRAHFAHQGRPTQRVNCLW